MQGSVMEGDKYKNCNLWCWSQKLLKAWWFTLTRGLRCCIIITLLPSLPPRKDSYYFDNHKRNSCLESINEGCFFFYTFEWMFDGVFLKRTFLIIRHSVRSKTCDHVWSSSPYLTSEDVLDTLQLKYTQIFNVAAIKTVMQMFPDASWTSMCIKNPWNDSNQQSAV